MKIIVGVIVLLAFIPYQPNGIVLATSIDKTLVQPLNQILHNEPNLAGAIAGISVRSASTGELLYEHMGSTRLKPASNLKLLTAAAALSVLGENYQFTTEVLTDGPIIEHTLQGNLYLKGKGDPTLLASDFDDFAEELNKKGVRIINGDLIGDDTWYDSIRHSIDLPWSDETFYYGAQVSALTASPTDDFDAGTVLIEIHPGSAIGQPAKIITLPENNYVNLENEAVTVSPDGRKELIIEREHGTNTIHIQGTIPIKANKTREWIAVWEPTGFALNLLQQSFSKQGIKWAGKVKTGTAPKEASL